MSLYLKIALIIFGLAYLISPVDIIPDLLPYIGWIDDTVVLATIFYLIRHGRLPNFFFKRQRPFKSQGPGHAHTKNTCDSAAKNFHSGAKASSKAGGTAYRKTTSSQKMPKTPYEVLGIKPDASKKEIQTAYRKAIKKYHPDKVSHLGEEFSNLANEKFLEIQNAYNILMKK
ncbi:MAG: DnaJ domain-containing protein [Deltaproteobacteria bacterium]|nr:DnaJ domain-containing protein [Deltaproteobacteria bacterium]